MSRALVLNATYEPLSVVAVRRAVVLVLDGKAEPVHESSERMHSEHLVVPVPSVVRLHKFVRVPHRRGAALSRRGVFMRDGGTCQYCGRTAESIDHVVPRSRGGAHTWDNVVAACRRCNANKRDRLLEETTMRLRASPGPPGGMTWLTGVLPTVPAHWSQYLGVPSSSVA